MSVPTRSDYRLARKGTLALIACGTWCAAMRCFTHTGEAEPVPWLCLGLGVLAAGASLKARRRIAVYQEWRGAWNDMAGVRPQEAKPAKAARRPAPRAAKPVLLALSWVLTACWLQLHAAEASTPKYACFAAALAFTSAWGAKLALLPLLPRRRRRSTTALAAKKSAEGFVVTACVPLPARSPTLREIKAALPDYCRRLLNRSDPPPTEPSHATAAQ